MPCRIGQSSFIPLAATNSHLNLEKVGAKPKRPCLQGRLIYPQAKGIQRAGAAAFLTAGSPTGVCVCLQ